MDYIYIPRLRRKSDKAAKEKTKARSYNVIKIE